MALSSDEKELVDSVDEAVESDYYPPLMALMFYRYNKESQGRAMATEDIKFLATQSWFDLNEYSAEKQAEEDSISG